MMTRMTKTIQIMVITKPGIAKLPNLATGSDTSTCRAYRNDLGINVEGRNSVIATGWDVTSLPAPTVRASL